jgi:anti-sigma factor RsiW
MTMPDDCCPDYLALIVRAADGALDADGRTRLDAHVGSCAACRQALAAQREVRAMLADLPAVAAPGALRARVRAALEAGGARRVPWLAGADFRRWTWRLVPVAAALIVGAVYGVEHGAASAPADAAASVGDLSVSAALYSTDVTDASMLSLLLQANADDTLADYLKD